VLPTLEDSFGRRIEYLRLSVTDRCDLRCFYRLPEGFHDYEEPKNWLTFDEIERVVRLFARMGTHRVRLTGGEPLVRRQLAELAARIAAVDGIDDLSLSTNATRLARQTAALRAAGISRLNVSLDTLRTDRFRNITKGQLHLEGAIREAIHRKPERHQFDERPGQIVRLMAQTGG